MSFVDDLIKTAELLCSPSLGRKRSQAMLKMGVYASYQALLHCLQNMCADGFIGDESEEDRPDTAWHEVYRSLKHEVLRKACSHQDMRFFAMDVIAYLLAQCANPDARGQRCITPL